MLQPWRHSTGDERGQATFTLIIVIAVVAVAVILLHRTASLADRINNKAGNIARVGGGINSSTRAVLELNKTNDLAGSILGTAQPLQGKLDSIVGLARDIDGLASSINTSASQINGTAKGINNTASTILNTARSINAGVAQINTNLDTTIAIAQSIKADTGGILGEANRANHLADCINSGAVSANPPAPGC
jgi:methyl-accepting chemotaxis protein